MRLISKYNTEMGYYRNKNFEAEVNINGKDTIAVFDVEVCKEVRVHRYYPQTPDEVEVLKEIYDISLVYAYTLDGEDVSLTVQEINNFEEKLKKELKSYI